MSLQSLDAAPTSAAFLRAVGEEVRAIRARAEERFAELDDVQLAWRPLERGWGVGECLEHVLLTNAHYLEHLEARAEVLGRATRDPHLPLRGGWLGRRFARMVGPDTSRRLPAPRALRPAAPSSRGDPEGTGVDPGPIVPRFLRHQDRILELLPLLEGLPLDRARIPSPATRLFRLKATDVVRVLVGHQWRHLAQAERVLGHPGFPG